MACRAGQHADEQCGWAHVGPRYVGVDMRAWYQDAAGQHKGPPPSLGTCGGGESHCSKDRGIGLSAGEGVLQGQCKPAELGGRISYWTHLPGCAPASSTTSLGSSLDLSPQHTKINTIAAAVGGGPSYTIDVVPNKPCTCWTQNLASVHIVRDAGGGLCCSP